LKLSFWEHVHALRFALLRGSLFLIFSLIIAFFFSDLIADWMLSPLLQQKSNLTAEISSSKTGLEELLILSPLEGLITSLKMSFWTGLLFSSPFWVFFLMQFFYPALKKKERKILAYFFILSFLCTGLGILFAHKISLPLMGNFLKSYNRLYGINAWSLSSCLSFCLWIILGHGIAFEFLAFLFLGIHFGFFSAGKLIDYRRYSIVGILILSALVTPPDLLSQLLLAIPLLTFYEISIIYSRFRQKTSKKQDLLIKNH
jgi:sec-independent protein translocase protein TatC